MSSIGRSGAGAGWAVSMTAGSELPPGWVKHTVGRCGGEVMSRPAGPDGQRLDTSKSDGSMLADRSRNSVIENGHCVTMRPDGDR